MTSRVRAEADTAHGDVAIGDHAHQTIVFTDRQHADIDFAHGSGGVPDGLLGIRDQHVPRHAFADFHSVLRVEVVPSEQ
jgi:hypothetical protein